MTEIQWAGACYVLAAVLGLIWWRLRIEAELQDRDNNACGEPKEEDNDNDEHKPED